MALEGGNIYQSPGNTGLATVLPTVEGQKSQQLQFLSRLKNINQQRRAQAAAEQQKQLQDMYKQAMDKGLAVQYAPYRKKVADMNKKTQEYNLDVLKRHGANVPQEEMNNVARKWNEVKRYKAGVDAIETDINTYFENLDKEAPINKESFSRNIAKHMTKDDGTMKDPHEVDMQEVIKQAEDDPTSYDLKKVNESFMSSVQEDVNSLVKNGPETREEFTVKSKLMEIDENGLPVPDPDTNEPKLKIGPELVQKYKNSPGGKAILGATVNQMYEDGFDGSIGSAERLALGTLVKSYAYRNVPKRNVENQPRDQQEGTASGRERQQYAKGRFEGYKRAVEGDATELRRIENGKTSQGRIVSVTPEGATDEHGFKSVKITFEREAEGRGDRTETVTESYNLDDPFGQDQFASVFNEALNSKSSIEKKVPWEDFRPFNDEYRNQRRQTRTQSPGPVDNQGISTADAFLSKYQ